MSGEFAPTTDPDTWTDFETAFEFLDTGEEDGVGFVFSEESVDADSVADVDKDAGRLVANFAVESDVCRLAAVVWISVLVADPHRSI